MAASRTSCAIQRKGIMQTGNKIVDAVSKLNIKPVEYAWYRTVVDGSGRTNLLAVAILSDVVYWYKWTEQVDESTNRIIGYKKKFRDDDYLQRSYGQLQSMFNVSRHQVYDALVLLEGIGVVTRVFKTINTGMGAMNNVMFLSVNPDKLCEITFIDTDAEPKEDEPVSDSGDTSLQNGNPLPTQTETPPYPNGKTYTSSPTTNTTKTTTSKNSSCQHSVGREQGEPDKSNPVKPKKQSLRLREPDNDIEKVEKTYLLEWDKLYAEKKVMTEQPPVTIWNPCRAMLKRLLPDIGAERICRAVVKALDDRFVMEGGYSLQVILSGTVLNRLLNGSSEQAMKRPVNRDLLSTGWDSVPSEGAPPEDKSDGGDLFF